MVRVEREIEEDEWTVADGAERELTIVVFVGE